MFHTVKEKAPNTEKDILPKSALYPYAPDHVLVVKMEIKLLRVEMDVYSMTFNSGNAIASEKGAH